MSLYPQGAFFDKVGIKYEEAFGHDKGLHDFVHASLDRLPSKGSILELGSGTGKPTADIAVKRGFRLHGVDISSTMVELAKSQVPQATFQQASMLDFEPEADGEAYDAMFTLFSHFLFSRDEMSGLASRWGGWVKPGGLLFVGTMVAEDFPTTPDMFDADGQAANGVGHTFMGDRFEHLLYTKSGWQELLKLGGFEVISTSMTPFQPPPDSGCDMEPHYYITARKTPTA